MTAFDSRVGAGLAQTLVECQGSGTDDDIHFDVGDLAVQAFPIGS